MSSDYLHREIILPHYKIVYKIPLRLLRILCLTNKLWEDVQVLLYRAGKCERKLADYKYTKK